MNLYQTNESIHKVGFKSYHSYGISCKNLHLRDLTLSPTRICRLVELCNQLELDPCHLEDVVEDFLGSLDPEEPSRDCRSPRQVAIRGTQDLRRWLRALPAAQDQVRQKLYDLACGCW